MLTYPTISPVLISIGPFAIHWYGFMYILAFTAAWVLLRLRARQQALSWTPERIEDLIFKGGLGVILGGRLGYMVLYSPHTLIDAPIEILYLWHGGMSFHGGMLGVFVAMWLAARQYKLSFIQVTDYIAPAVPIGIGFGRIGNFIGAQLYGRVTDMPWGMVFPNGGPLARHPSQLYQAAIEGFGLFIALWWFSSKPRPQGAVSGFFMVGYGIARAWVECYREPDEQIGLLWLNLTMGQLLSIPMVVVGGALLVHAYRSKSNSERGVCSST